MTTTYLPGNKQWLGLAKETTYGTPVATPTIWIPVDTPVWKPVVTPLVDQALRGDMGTDFGQTQGMRHDELTYKTYIYQDSAFPHFLAALGNPDTVVGTATPYTHKTSLYNGSTSNNAQPPSYTGFLYQVDGKVVQIPGMVIGDVKVTIKADTLPTIDVQWLGLPGAFITAPSNTPSTLQPYPPFTASVTLGGTALNAESDITIDIKRNTAAIPVLNGTQSPLAIFGGPVTVTGTLGAIYQGTTDTHLTDFLANTQPALVLAITPQGVSAQPLTFQMSKVAFDTAEPAGSNSSWMTLQSNFKALMNATDALDGNLSPIQVQLTNATATPF
ncbi:MAG: phage tail tube protein [Marmoricola sp.]